MDREAQLKQDIEAMEAVINPVEESIASIPEEPQSAPVEAITEDPTVEVKERKPRNNWKKRFTGYKNATDATIFSLRQELTNRSEEITALNTKFDLLKNSITDRKVDIFDGVITDEETEILGPEAVDSMKKVTKAAVSNAVNPLKEELAESKEKLRKTEEARISSDRAKTQASFLERLGNVVEDYVEINVDPDFLSYMNEIEPLSGHPRSYLFKSAEQLGNVREVASFFNDFKSIKEHINPILEESITPVNNAVGSTDTQQTNTNEPMSIVYINQEYAKANRGKYIGRESEWKAISARIDKAVSSGNIVQ